VKVTAESAGNGVFRGPIASAARVSTRRHGVVGTKTVSSLLLAPDANWVPTNTDPTVKKNAAEINLNLLSMPTGCPEPLTRD
jgi:hypothetical protein